MNSWNLNFHFFLSFTLNGNSDKVVRVRNFPAYKKALCFPTILKFIIFDSKGGRQEGEFEMVRERMFENLLMIIQSQPAPKLQMNEITMLSYISQKRMILYILVKGS